MQHLCARRYSSMTSPLCYINEGGWSPSGPHNAPYLVHQRSSPDAVAIDDTPSCCYSELTSGHQSQRTARVLPPSLIQTTHEDVQHATTYGQRQNNAPYGGHLQHAERARKEHQLQQQYLDTQFPLYSCYQQPHQWNVNVPSR